MFAHKTANPQTKAPAESGSFERVHPQRRNTAAQTLLPRPGFAGRATAGLVQPKLEIGAADDPLEREADRAADLVMRMPDPPLSEDGVRLQRKCAACDETERKPVLRAKRAGADSARAEAPPAVQDVLRSGGEPLDAAARAFFEPRFGRDFSQVRVHADDRAARSAQSIGSLAYAVGSNIVFAKGQYAPRSVSGRHLLAHELAHTVQQGQARVRRSRCQDEVGIGGTVEETVQRKATWKGATVHETFNKAVGTLDGTAPVTWQMLNGAMLKSDADADAAIKVPTVTTLPYPTTGDPNTRWAATVDAVPEQEGGDDETVLSPGPWSAVTTKAKAGTVTGLAACTGAGACTFTMNGKPSDDAVFKANRRHEDHHVADDKVAFEENIGAWDKKLQEAKDKGSEFRGATADAATAALWAAMGNTPTAAARAYNQASLAKGGAFHNTPAGGAMQRSNPTSNADCSTAAMEVTNPS